MFRGRAVLLGLAVIAAIALSAAPLLKASSEVSEPNEEFICDSRDILYCRYLFLICVLMSGILYHMQAIKVFFKAMVSYLAKHENSPPQNAARPLTPNFSIN